MVSKFDKGIVIVASVAFLVMVVLSLLQHHKEADLGPTPVERVYTPYEATVEVSAYFDEQRSYGYGIVVRHDGQMFVLTSSMIFPKDVECIAVAMPECTSMAEILHQNDICGLVALDCGFPANTPFVELNGDPNLPPGVPVEINKWPASTLEYINNDWALLGDISEDCTGHPVTQNGYVVGIVVGMNRINQDQAIMVGNRALKEFCDQTTLMDAPPVLEIP